MRKQHAMALLALSLLISSCLGWLMEAPSIVLRDVNARPLSLTEIQLLIGLEVQNPNRFDLTLASLEYAVYLKEEKIGHGALEQEVRISGQSTTRLQIPVKAQFSDWNKSLKTLMTGGDTPYKIEGTAVVRTFFGRLEFPFSQSGRINP